jgi:hypothetical protein
MSEATDAMFNITKIADGLNDDLIVTLYNNEYTDTIGVPTTQDKYSLMVYVDGCYNEKDAQKIVRDRVTKILHEMSEIGNAVLKETQEQVNSIRTVTKKERTDDDDKIMSYRDLANGLKEFASRCRNDARRNSINASIAKANSIPPDRLDVCETILSLPNGSLIIDFAARTVTYDPARHPEAYNTMVMSIPYDEKAGYKEFSEYITDLLSWNIRHFARTDIEEIRAEERLVRGIFGYMMLCGNPEQVIMLLGGSGGSGKGTVAALIAEVLGTYAIAGRRELVVRQENERIRADVGISAVKHFVYADELRPGDVIDTGALKYMTNAKMIVEVKHKNPVERKNNMKLLIISNHDNKLDSQDDSVERRLITLNFYKERPSVHVADYHKVLIKKFGPAILNYAIDGLKDLLQAGGILKLIPAHIKKDIHDKLVMQDRLKLFFEKHLPQSKDVTDTVKLNDSWEDMNKYYEALGEQPPVKVSNRYGNLLRTYGYETFPSSGYVKIRGANRRPFISLDDDYKTSQEIEDGLTFVSQKDRICKLKEIIGKLQREVSDGAAPLGFIETIATQNNIETRYVKPELRVMTEIGELLEVRPGYYKTT